MRSALFNTTLGALMGACLAAAYAGGLAVALPADDGAIAPTLIAENLK